MTDNQLWICMTDNQLKLEVLKLAIDGAREAMFAERIVLENRWQARTTEEAFPELPGIDVGKIVAAYEALMGALK